MKLADKFQFFSKWKNLTPSREVLYISKFCPVPKIEKRVDIILSPLFYWIKKESLQVKKEREALQFAESIFEGQFENLESYRFVVSKIGEGEFIFIAYNPLEILQSLEKLGIPHNLIGNIYTAQTEFQALQDRVTICLKRELIAQEGIVSELPKNNYDVDENLANLYLKERERVGESLKIEKSQKRNWKFLPLIPISLILYFGLDYFKLSRDLTQIQKEIETRRELYKLPATSFQIKSIKNRFQEIEAKQGRVRDFLYWLQKSGIKKFGKIDYLKLTQKELTFKIELKEKVNINRLKTILQKRDREVEIEKVDNSLEVGFKI